MADFAKIVLECDGNRDTDKFLEVHIYKELSNLAVKTVLISMIGNKTHESDVKAIEYRMPDKVKRI